MMFNKQAELALAAAVTIRTAVVVSGSRCPDDTFKYYPTDDCTSFFICNAGNDFGDQTCGGLFWKTNNGGGTCVVDCEASDCAGSCPPPPVTTPEPTASPTAAPTPQPTQTSKPVTSEPTASPTPSLTAVPVHPPLPECDVLRSTPASTLECGYDWCTPNGLYVDQPCAPGTCFDPDYDGQGNPCIVLPDEVEGVGSDADPDEDEDSDPPDEDEEPSEENPEPPDAGPKPLCEGKFSPATSFECGYNKCTPNGLV